jgi:peptidoglycan hydrolase-like protein with peptidoglycan-binding domain
LRLIFLPLPIAICAALAIGAWAAPQTSTVSSNKKKSAAKTGTAKTAPKAAAATPKHTATLKASPARRPVVVARHPQQPSPERYKEIQQALAAKGYFTAEPDGTWGPASVESLKRFQHDQKLLEDGKIGSLSLIALGLGPKREPAPEAEQKTP